MQEIPLRADYIHHKTSRVTSSIREVVFGAEDGMVSTLGALTGIAIGTNDHFTIVLSGFVIVAVESVAMTVGSYLSAKSEREVDLRKLEEEKQEIRDYPQAEEKELSELYAESGWPTELAQKMARTARENPALMLQEMAYRELNVSPDKAQTPLQDALFMFFSYAIGGFIPIAPYLLLPLPQAIILSILITLAGLFSLGAATTRFTRRAWWKAGLEMLALASLAASIGYAIGRIADRLFLS